jgi:hemerythrin superfamily protein
MNIYSYLKKDHRKVSDLMEQVIASRSPEKRETLFEQIKQELDLHSKTEEATFYATLENIDEAQEKIDHAEEEHDEIKMYLKKLSSMSAKSEKWLEVFGEFKHCVEHHVKEEEGEIFDKARKLLSEEEAVRLAEQMDAMKQEMKPNAKRSTAA